MGKITDGVRKFATKMGGSLRWPKRKPTASEQRQVERWEAEGGSIRDDDTEPR
jgi:hypothetical protein